MKVTDSLMNIGIGLSGGGYRAAIYHLGIFKALSKIEISLDGQRENYDTISIFNNIANASYTTNTAKNFTKFRQTNS